MNEPSQRNVVTVSKLTAAIKNRLNHEFSSVWVAGEMSGITRAASGHVYLTLKDKTASLNAIIWRSTDSRLKFDLTDGLEVVCEGGIDVYPQRGTYQLIIRKVQPKGIGALELAFRQLHDKLKVEGLFDPANKKPLPQFPKHIAVVTSPTSAAVRDFLQVLTRRWPNIRVTIIPARVQGSGAAREIANGIGAASRFADRPDVLVVTRGGGSIEDLWSFNEEVVCRAVYACPIPVVSGVGHEIDVTLCDLVADVRALTPSEAAERIVPDLAEIQVGLRALQRSLGSNLLSRLRQAQRQVDSLESRPVIRRPLEQLRRWQMEIDQLQQSLSRAGKQRATDASQKLGEAATKLESLNPLAVLARGYSVTTDESGKTLTDCRNLKPDDKIRTRLANGSILSRVDSVD